MSELSGFYAAHALWIWVALAAALLAVEVATGSGWLLWPAASAAIVAAPAGFAGLGPLPATLAFAVLTILSTVLARRYLPRRLLHDPEHDINDATARLIGRQGRVVTAFRDRSGRVFIDGKEWAAELDEGEALETGARVEVTGVAGAHLKVRAA